MFRNGTGVGESIVKLVYPVKNIPVYQITGVGTGIYHKNSQEKIFMVLNRNYVSSPNSFVFLYMWESFR
jgi:hypothetical protein